MSPAFADFTEKLIHVIKDKPDVAAILFKNIEFRKFLETLVFDFKPRISEKESTLKLIETYNSLLSLSKEEVIRLVDERVLILDNSFMISTIKALDIKIRSANATMLTHLVLKLFEFGEQGLIDKIFDCCLNLLSGKECANNWLKIDQFLEFFYRVLTSGKQQFEYLISKDLATKLLDLALGPESPLASVSDPRQKMGSEHAHPPFEYLIRSVSFIVRNCDRVVQGGELEGGPVSPFFLNTWGQSYPLSDDAINMVFIVSFISNQARAGTASFELGLYAGHLCFRNESFSRDVSDKLIWGLNDTNENNCTPILHIMKPVLSIVDCYSRHRYEWLMGIPETSVRYPNNPAGTIPRCGVGNISTITTDWCLYKSTLSAESNNYNEPVLKHTYTNQRRYSKMVLMMLEMLYSVLVIEHQCSGPLYHYINKLIPPPSYVFSRWTDWVEPFVNERI